MRRRVLIVTLVLYVALLVAPVLVHTAGVRRFISGALPPDQRPELSFAALRDERYQQGVTRWLENHRTMFGWTVYADNTVLHRILGETRVGARVVLGRDRRVLFIDEDIGFFNTGAPGIPAPSVVDAMAARLARVQRALQARGKSLVPVIAPAKTSVFREQVDPRWRRFPDPVPSDVGVYQALVAALDRHGVAYVDMRAELTSGRHARADVWAPEARHWSTYAACLAWQQITERHARLLGGPRLPYNCRLGHEPAGRVHPQFDLWRLLNVWTVPRSSTTAPVALHEAPAGDASSRPRVLLVGTSFQFEVLLDGQRSGLLRDVEFLYYDSRLLTSPEAPSRPMSAGGEGWDALMAEKDLIVLDLLEAGVFSGATYHDRFLRAEDR